MPARESRVRKRKQEFVLIIDGPIVDDDVIEMLFEAGCGDATFGISNEVGSGSFHRTAPSLAHAIDSAIEAVESIPSLRVIRVESEDLLTMAEIARRLGRTRESVRLLVEGKRGKGGFPRPYSGSGRWRLWRWSDVAAWVGNLPSEEVERARLIAAVNAALELRRHRPGLDDTEKRLIDALAS